MIKRKLVRLGKSSLVISLPKKWLKKYNLQAGDEVIIIEKSDGSLEIRPRGAKRCTPISIVIAEEPPQRLVERLLIASYVMGRDPIKVKIGRFSKTLQEIYRVIEKIKELEIVEEHKTDSLLEINLCAVVKAVKRSIAECLQRMSELIQTMVMYLVAAFDSLDVGYIEEISYLESEVDAIYLKALRSAFEAMTGSPQLEETGVLEAYEISSYLAITVLYEIIADLINSIAQKAKDVGLELIVSSSCTERLKSLLREYQLAIEIISKTLFFGDARAANDALNMLAGLEVKCKGLGGEDGKARDWLREFTLRFSSMTDFLKVVAEIALDLAVGRSEEIALGDLGVGEKS